MGRKRIGPRKVHGPEGLYFAVTKDGEGREYRVSLRTRDHATAMRRYGPAMAELRQRIQQGPTKPKGPASYARDELFEVWDVETGEHHPEPALNVLREDQIGLSWEQALEVHARRKAEQGKPLAESTLKVIDLALRGELAGTSVDQLSRAHVVRYVDGLRQRNLSAKTIAQRCSLLQAIITTGMKQGLLPEAYVNPFGLVDTSAATSKPITTASPEQIKTLLDAYQGDREKLNALRLLVYTGMRISELTSRQPSHLKDGWLEICPTDTWRLKSPSSERLLPVPEGCSIPKQWKDPTSVRNWIKAVDPGISPHSLRHAFRTACRDAGLSTELAEHLMGHSQSVRLAKTYGLFTREAVEAGMARVWEAINGWVKS